MSILNNIRRGKIAAPYKALLYGVEGIGKTTFGAESDRSIFLCAENGTEQMDVARLPTPKSWRDVEASVHALTSEKHDFGTLVIDTLDWLEPLLWNHVCASNKWADIEEPGYGKGYLAALSEWRTFLASLEAMRKAGLNTLFLAHAHVKRHSPPGLEPFDKFSLKINEKAAALVREWVDYVLFAEHEVITAKKKDERVARAYSTGERVIHTTPAAAYDAKHRGDKMPDPLPLSFAAFEAARKGGEATAEEVTTEEIEAVIAEAAPDKHQQWRDWINKQNDKRAALATAADRITKAKEAA